MQFYCIVNFRKNLESSPFSFHLHSSFKAITLDTLSGVASQNLCTDFGNLEQLDELVDHISCIYCANK